MRAWFREFVDYWWRLLKLFVGAAAIPVAIYLVLLWLGVFK